MSGCEPVARHGGRRGWCAAGGAALVCAALLLTGARDAGACFYHERGFNTKDGKQTTVEKVLGGAYAPGDLKREREEYLNRLRRAEAELPGRREDPDFLDEYAYLLYRNGKEAEAYRIWSDLLRKDPNRFSTLCNSATALQIRGRMEEAAKRIGKAAGLRPDFRSGAERWHARMIDYQIRTRTVPGYAREHLFIDELTPLWFGRKGIEDLPEFPIEVTSQGLAELLREFPTFADGWVVLGMALEREGDAYTALAAYRRAIKHGTSQRVRIESFLKEFEKKAARENPARRTARALLRAIAVVAGAVLFLFLFRFVSSIWSDVRESRDQKGGGRGGSR